MLMGVISLLLTVGQNPISKICIPKEMAYTMLPCKKEVSAASGGDNCSKQVNTALHPGLILHSIFDFFNAIADKIDSIVDLK